MDWRMRWLGSVQDRPRVSGGLCDERLSVRRFCICRELCVCRRLCVISVVALSNNGLIVPRRDIVPVITEAIVVDTISARWIDCVELG